MGRERENFLKYILPSLNSHPVFTRFTLVRAPELDNAKAFIRQAKSRQPPYSGENFEAKSAADRR